MSVNYALAYKKSAPVYRDFVRPFLERHFSAAVVDALFEALPVYSRGPRKGLKKGYVHWTKVERGGWHREGPSYNGSPQGRVLYPGTWHVYITLTNQELSTTVLDEHANATDEGRIAGIRNVLAAKDKSPRDYLSRRVG